MSERLSAARRGDTRDSQAHTSLWLPVFVEWQPRRMQLLEDMRDGLFASGADVRVDTVGDHQRPLSMLRVRCPGLSIEAAEQWLLRLSMSREDTEWSGGVYCLLHQRWREYPLLSCTPEEMEQQKERIPGLDRSAHGRFAGTRFGLVCGERHMLFTYARPATEVVRSMPGVQVHGHVELDGDPRQWLAIDVAHTLAEVLALSEFGAGLATLGFAVCRYEWRDGQSALLTIHAGEGTIEDLEARLAATWGVSRPAWAERYRPWSWHQGVWVHRHPESLGWRLREWLERELGLPVVDALAMPGQEILLKVPVPHVDRALELLARRPAGF